MKLIYHHFVYTTCSMLAVKIRRKRAMLSLGFLSISLLPLFVACGNVASGQSDVVRMPPVAANSPSWVKSAKQQSFRSHGQYIAAEAIAIASGLYGAHANEYYTDDPAMAPAIAYWKRSCQNADGSLCSDAKSGNLQCVEFVSSVFALIDDDLPYGGNADQFWNLYQGKTGWQEIPATTTLKSVPELGDIMAWSGNATGHLSVVIDLQMPTKKDNGYIVVAHSNATHAFERLAWHTNGQVDSWSGYQLQGFIRQQEIAPCLRPQATDTQQQWETLAIEAAVHYGVPSKYFLRQLCQSGFQAKDQQGHAVISSTGAIGIAQLPASIAAQIPRCVINFIANVQNCGQIPGSLPEGTGIDPAQPAESLPAAAYEMSTLYSHYVHMKGMQTPQDDVEAYKMALAAYNARDTFVDKAVNVCGKNHWLDCLDEQQKSHSVSEYVSEVLTVG